MAGGAAGGFLTRAFESMLKECSGKKYTSIQTAIRSYLGLCFLFRLCFYPFDFFVMPESLLRNQVCSSMSVIR